ncbi:YrbL family protein [Salinisphaera sp. SPP-AMP-43]|uniref:YrbL family protein n=1 Tax=Salinisphaera sp. SPP-AMP-43 TaxID=3121288 RepID=UPI003C6E83A9
MSLLSRTIRRLLPYRLPAIDTQRVYTLDTRTELGRGSKRRCYAHPSNPGLCIKVARWPQRSDAHEASLVEWYCSRGLDRRGVSYTHRPHIHGWIATDQGPGLVVERIRDHDDTPSLKLHEALARGLVAAESVPELLAQLKDWVMSSGVAVNDLSLGNMLLRRRDNAQELVLIDGIGGQKIKLKFMLYRRFGWFARSISRHRWPRYERKIYARIGIGDRETALHTAFEPPQRPPAIASVDRTLGYGTAAQAPGYRRASQRSASSTALISTRIDRTRSSRSRADNSAARSSLAPTNQR